MTNINGALGDEVQDIQVQDKRVRSFDVNALCKVKAMVNKVHYEIRSGFAVKILQDLQEEFAPYFDWESDVDMPKIKIDEKLNSNEYTRTSSKVPKLKWMS